MPTVPAHRIILVEYDPAWATDFEEERVRLQTAIGEWALAIEHIGSTAIPGISAKPIIDIGVPLNAFADALYCITPLHELGYQCLGEFHIPGRIFFRKLTDTPKLGQVNNGIGRTHHIHMYEQHHEQFIWQIAFRDYLRAHPDDAREYERLKQRLAEKYGGDGDVEKYALNKRDFVREILAKAGISDVPANPEE